MKIQGIGQEKSECRDGEGLCGEITMGAACSSNEDHHHVFPDECRRSGIFRGRGLISTATEGTCRSAGAYGKRGGWIIDFLPTCRSYGAKTCFHCKCSLPPLIE